MRIKNVEGNKSENYLDKDKDIITFVFKES